MGKSIGQWPGLPVLSCRCSPHFLPLSPKVGAGRGNGGGNRIVTQMRSLSIGQVRSLKCACSPPCLKGEMLSVFLICVFVVWFLSFAVFWQSSLLLRVGLCNKFSGANFCFLLSFCVLEFLIGICLCFSRISCKFAPEESKEILLMSGLVFCLVLSVLGFGLTTFFLFLFSLLFFFEEIKLRPNRTPHTPLHVLLFFFFFLFCPRRFVLFTCFGRASFFVLGFLRGAILGPARFLDSLG